MLNSIQSFTTAFADLAWGPWLLWLLLGGGFYFLVRSRFTPFRYLGHAIDLIRGKYDNPDHPGHINHFSALSAALAGTIGMGNIAGVALAIKIGGPGAIFWMWMTAILGIATKFFTCTLAVMYRGKDDAGELQGGPMYVIREGLPKRFHFLAFFFAIVGMVGCLPALQANQLIQIFRDLVFIEQGIIAPGADPFLLQLKQRHLISCPHRHGDFWWAASDCTHRFGIGALHGRVVLSRHYFCVVIKRGTSARCLWLYPKRRIHRGSSRWWQLVGNDDLRRTTGRLQQ